eukprot:1021621-Rhodomonas_salina.4
MSGTDAGWYDAPAMPCPVLSSSGTTRCAMSGTAVLYEGTDLGVWGYQVEVKAVDHTEASYGVALLALGLAQ